MQEKTSKRRVQLDWSRLLGFDQAPAPDRECDPTRRRVRLARLGSRVSVKPGVKENMPS